MNNLKDLSVEEVLQSTHYLPCISLIMPFDPKMGLKKEVNHKLKLAANQIKRQVFEQYPEEKAKSVTDKLMMLIDGLNYNTHKKSVAIFVSPIFEKVIYLDMPVEEKMIIDESFEIRDLILNKKETQQYLLVLLSGKWTKVYLGHNGDMNRVTVHFSDNIEAYKNDIPEKVANFSDEQKRKEILLAKFLRQTDNGLAQLLHMYQGPVFVMGTVKTIGHFKQLTKNASRIVDYIAGNFEEKTDHELQSIMRPYLINWKQVRQKSVLKMVEDAMDKRRLVHGVHEVWRSASQKQGRVLVVEKSYRYEAEHTDSLTDIRGMEKENTTPFYIKDAVDDIIEKVLMSGGSIEFVDDGMLIGYNHIALVEYYD
ncbi:MAG: hypothetical protein RIR96_753 [Bacteroidota bacterium]